MFGIVGQTKRAAVCLHSAQVTRQDGTWVTVRCGVRKVFVSVWHKNETKSIPLHVWNEKMRIEWLHERQAQIRKTVAVTFLIWPAFSHVFRFIWSGNQGGQRKCPSYSNTDRMAGTYEYFVKIRQHRTRSYAKSKTNGKKRNKKCSNNLFDLIWFDLIWFILFIFEQHRARSQAKAENSKRLSICKVATSSM